MIKIQFTKRQADGLIWMRSPRELATSGLLTLGFGLIAALSGPFGTFYDFDLLGRLGYWLGSFVAGWTIIVASILLLLPLLIGFGLSSGMAGAVLGGLGALPLALLVMAINRSFRPSLDQPDLYIMYGYVALFAVPMTAGMVWASWRRSLDLVPPLELDPVPPRPSFLARIPAKLGSDLLALESEDHYIRVHTMLGNDLILMRMADALEELKGVDGMRVHRSYWVARVALTGAHRAGRRLTLTLKNGLQVPVSRANVSALKERGWLIH